MGETAEEWIGRLKMKATECMYKEKDRRLKEQFIKGINDKSVTNEIIKDFTSIKTPVKKQVNRYCCRPKG